MTSSEFGGGDGVGETEDYAMSALEDEICADECVALEGELTTLEELIARKGYDPKLLDEYFKEHPSQLASRAASVTGSFAKIGWLYSRKDFTAVVEAVEKLGPTYVKFGQALASRADLVGAELAGALEKLQDEMEPAPIEQARAIVATELPAALCCLEESSEGGGVAIAAASLCQVYKGTLAGRKVAIKVQRPGIASRVAADAALLRAAAKALEATGGTKAAAVNAVDEFASRIFEEMDFVNEAANIRRFDALYGPNGTSRHALPPPGFVRVPELLPEFPATRRVLVMEWLDGERVMSLMSPNQAGKQGKETHKTKNRGEGGVARDGASGADGRGRKIAAGEDPWSDAQEEEEERVRRAASISLIDLGIRCTLSQLIETGVMHADPHGGNLLRLNDSGDLAYLDFGLVSEVPPTVRDGLVAAVTLLVFSRDYEAVAGLFGELMLVPPDVIENEYQFRELANSLREAAEATLIFPSDIKADIIVDEEAEGAAAKAGKEGVGSSAAATSGAETTGAAATGGEAVEGEGARTAEQNKRDALLRKRGRGLAAVPDVRFDQLLGAILALVPRFRFVLPPYFLNNARALGTLEGMARSADPTFNILAVVYPFAVKRLLANPSGSPVLRRVLRRLISDEKTGELCLTRLRDMVDDAAALTGVPRNVIIKDALKTSEGVRLAFEAAMAAVRNCVNAFKSFIAIITGLRSLKRRWQRAMLSLRDGTYNQINHRNLRPP